MEFLDLAQVRQFHSQRLLRGDILGNAPAVFSVLFGASSWASLKMEAALGANDCNLH